MTFSKRMGFKPARAILQTDDIDHPLRVALFNLIYNGTSGNWYTRGGYYGAGHEIASTIWTEFFRHPVDTFSDVSQHFANELKDYIGDQPWYEVYDLLEFFASCAPYDESEFNRVLERDMSGYRIRGGNIIPITDETELAAIDETLKLGDKFMGSREHIRESLSKLARRPNPDFRNAITEAISAVESAARIVTGIPKATLADALKVLERNGSVHPALKDAWLKMYGYTSDEHGLRHAMTEDPNIDFQTAKYMVVTCSAFVNLLSATPNTN